MSASSEASTDLPSELLDAIISYLDNTEDLLSLCLANSYLRNVTSRHLYRSVHLHRLRPTIKFCHLLSSKPQLALHVSSLDIVFGNVSDWQFIQQWTPNHLFQATFTPPCFRLIFRAIRSMKNLKELTFDDASEDFARMPSENLGRCAPQLKRLAFVRGNNIDLALKSQPALQELMVSNRVLDHSLSKLHASELPSLRRIRCDSRDLAAVVPQRSVEHVQISDILPRAQDALPRWLNILSQSRCPVKQLELAVHYLEQDAFLSIAISLPRLEKLEIFDISAQAVSVALLRQPDTITALQNLKYLCRLRLYSSCTFIESDYATLVIRLGDNCPTLSEFTCVDLRTTLDIMFKPRTTYSYTRDTSSPGSKWRYRLCDTPAREVEKLGW